MLCNFQMRLGSAFGAFLDPVADKVGEDPLPLAYLHFMPMKRFLSSLYLIYLLDVQLMVAATLILLCTKPMDAIVLGPVPWLVTVPSIAIIGREVRYS